MSRSERREYEKAKEKEIKRLFALPPGKLEPVDLSTAPFVPPYCTRAFRNNRYTITINDNEPTTAGNAIHCYIQRHGNVVIPNHWSEIQKIKNELFGLEAMAIEYYPAESELLDTHNIYHIWVFPKGVIPIWLRR